MHPLSSAPTNPIHPIIATAPLGEQILRLPQDRHDKRGIAYSHWVGQAIPSTPRRDSSSVTAAPPVLIQPYPAEHPAVLSIQRDQRRCCAAVGSGTNRAPGGQPAVLSSLTIRLAWTLPSRAHAWAERWGRRLGARFAERTQQASGDHQSAIVHQQPHLAPSFFLSLGDTARAKQTQLAALLQPTDRRPTSPARLCVPVSEFTRLGERPRVCVCPKPRVLTPGLAARDNDSGAACPATVCLLISQAETDRSCRVCRRKHKDERSNP